LNYVGLVNGARYLSALDDQYRILRKRTVLLDDLPDTGIAAWWRIQRSLPERVAPVHALRGALSVRAETARALSIA